jgi:hypothetical protein
MNMLASQLPSPLVGEDAAFRLSGGQPAALHGGGPAASAADENPLFAEQLAGAIYSAPPPHPPHEGEGLPVQPSAGVN